MKKSTHTLPQHPPHSKIFPLLLLQIAVGLGLITGSLYIFLRLANDVMQKQVISFDAAITQAVYAWRSPFLTDIMNGITFLGSHVFLAISMVAIILFLLRTNRKNALLFSFILSFGVGLNFLLKLLFERPRPDFMPLIDEISYSFPSGHAMNSFIFYACVSFFIFRHFKMKTLGWIHIAASAILVLLIGVSRIYLGAHYPSDVVAGYAAGLLWFILVLFFGKSLTFLKLLKR